MPCHIFNTGGRPYAFAITEIYMAVGEAGRRFAWLFGYFLGLKVLLRGHWCCDEAKRTTQQGGTDNKRFHTWTSKLF